MFQVEIRLRKLVFSICFLAFAIFFVDLIAYFNGLYVAPFFSKYLNPTLERNIPTLLSSFSFFVVSLLLFNVKLDGDLNPKKWKFFGYFFLYLTLDDLLMIHEQVGSFIGKRLLKGSFSSYYWQGIYDPVFSIIFLALYIFVSMNLLHNKEYKAFVFLSMGYILYFISQSMDFYEGLRTNMKFFTKSFHLSKYQVIHVLRSMEETLEIVANVFVALSILPLTSIKKIAVSIKTMQH